MNPIPETKIDALAALGYSEEEARFLYLVATHSGYFVARQFLGFTGSHWGKRTTLFWNRLQANQHVRTYRFAQCGAVYHLYSRRIYRQIGHENLRNRRDHEFAYVNVRLAMLDFVLGNLDNQYLETEPAKVAYFSHELSIPTHHLPSKTYAGRHTVQPTVRYFVDRFPIFFPTPHAEPRVVTFTYLQGPEENLASFVHHLHSYVSFFRQLSEFAFLFLARNEAHFVKAAELFRALVVIPLESNPADDLLRYFRIRKAWDLAKYTTVTEADLIFRNLAKERFAGARFEHFYRAWKVGRIGEGEIREEFRGSDKPHAIHFEARILKAISSPVPESTGNR